MSDDSLHIDGIPQLNGITQANPIVLLVLLDSVCRFHRVDCGEWLLQRHGYFRLGLVGLVFCIGSFRHRCNLVNKIRF